jgi:hypothetical protein
VKLKVLWHSKAIGRVGATALCAAALVFAAAHAAVGDGGNSNAPDPSPTFTVTSTISSSSSSPIPALLYPGVHRYLWYSISNTLQVPITVTSVGISNVVAPAGCPISNLDFSATTFSGSLVVAALGTNSVEVPISLNDTDTNQDSCEGTTYEFSYTGSAVYTEVYDTAAAVIGAPSPSNVGDSVVYTATVTASASAGQDPVPNSPTGTVTFMDGPTTICAAVPVTSTGTTTSTATCSPYAYSGQGTHSITAIFANSDGNFTGATSPIFSQVVDP